MKKKPEWWDIRIHGFTSGDALLRLMVKAWPITPWTSIILSKIDGAKIGGLVDAELTQNNMATWYFYKNSDFFKRVHEVIQFDWGDFLCIQDIVADLEEIKKMSYPELIRIGVLIIRAIDGYYFEVYTQSDVLMKSLRDSYPHCDAIKGNLDEFTFAY